MTIHIDISDAGEKLSNILNKVIEGEEVVIDKSGDTVAKLVAAKRKNAARRAGIFKDVVSVSEDIDKPLPEEILFDR